jgi:hypothetical protein
MAYSLENTSDLTALGDAIRAKTGDSDTMTVAEMATAVNGITTGGGITPSGMKYITSMDTIDVTNYATAKVSDSDIVESKIKKNVNILGVKGTYEGPAMDIYSWKDGAVRKGSFYYRTFTSKSTSASMTFTLPKASYYFYLVCTPVSLGSSGSATYPSGTPASPLAIYKYDNGTVTKVKGGSNINMTVSVGGSSTTITLKPANASSWYGLYGASEQTYLFCIYKEKI